MSEWFLFLTKWAISLLNDEETTLHFGVILIILALF